MYVMVHLYFIRIIIIITSSIILFYWQVCPIVHPIRALMVFVVKKVFHTRVTVHRDTWGQNANQVRVLSIC